MRYETSQNGLKRPQKTENANSSVSQDIEEESNKIKLKTESDIYKMQSKKKSDTIKLDNALKVNKINIFGLYDPDDFDLNINMWSNSDGDQLKNILKRLTQINLSDDATEIMKIEIEKLNFKDSQNKLISNVTADEISTKEELKELLIKQIENRVRWREIILNMINKGVNHFIEIGPGKVLSGLVKRIDKSVKINSINNEIDIKDLKI